MSELARIVALLRQFMESLDAQPRPEHAQAAEAYARAVTETNERLTRCRELIDRGLRSEAIHQADTEPRLLNLVSVLDFPNVERLPRLAFNCGWAVIAPLNMRDAEQLNEAYAQVRPLEALLERHRLLALRRAPLVERLDTIRKIAVADPMSAFWSADQASYETARLVEMQAEFREAVRIQDEPTILALADEMRRSEWAVKPPASLKDGLRSESGKIAAARYEAERNQLVSKVHAAVATQHLPTAVAAQLALQQFLDQNTAILPPALVAELQPAYAWIQAEQTDAHNAEQYADAVHAFDTALVQKAAFPKLQSLMDRFVELDQAPPLHVEAAFVRARDRHVHAKYLRQGLIGVAVVVLLAGSAFGFIKYQDARASATAVNEAKIELNRLLDSGAIQDAKETQQRLILLHPSLADDPEIEKLARKIDEQLQLEASRAKAFASRLAQAKQIPEQDSIEESSATLLAKQAQLPEEKLAVESWIGERRRNRAARIEQAQAERERKILAQLPNVDATIRLARLTRIDEDALVDAKSRLKEADTALQTLEGDVTKLGAPITTQIVALRTAWKEADRNYQSACVQERNLRALVGTVREATFDPDRYSTALNDYAQSLGSAPEASARVLALRETATAATGYQTILRWSEAIATAGPNCLNISATEASTVQSKFNRLRTDYPEDFAEESHCFYLKPLNEYESALKAILRREPAVAEFQAYLKRPHMRDILRIDYTVGPVGRVMYAGGGKRLEGELQTMRLGNGTKTVRSFANDKSSVILSMDGSNKLLAFETAAQCLFAEKAEDRLNLYAASGAGWDEIAVELLDQRLRSLSSRKFEPLLQVILYRRVLQMVSRGDPALEAEYAPLLKRIADSGVNLDAPWYFPEDDEAIVAATRAAKLFAELPKVGPGQFKAAAARNETTRRLLESLYRIGGVVLRNPDGELTCRWLLGRKGQYGIYAPKFVKGRPTDWIDVGSVSDGTVQFRSDRQAELREGGLVFVRASVERPLP